MRQGLHRAVFKNLNLLSLQSRWGFNCGFCCSNAWRKYTTRGLVSRRGVSLSLSFSLYIHKIDVNVCLFTLKYDVLTQPQGIAVEAREALLRRASQGTFNFILNKWAHLLFYYLADSLSPLFSFSNVVLFFSLHFLWFKGHPGWLKLSPRRLF